MEEGEERLCLGSHLAAKAADRAEWSWWDETA